MTTAFTPIGNATELLNIADDSTNNTQCIVKDVSGTPLKDSGISVGVLRLDVS